jgi:hypothetical protein
MHIDLAAMSIDDAFAHGDMNGDFTNDYSDSRIFKAAYESLQGAGAYARALAVPEPTAAWLLSVAAISCAELRRRRHPIAHRS